MKYCIELTIPPVAKIGNPGIALAIAETALSATGRIAFPDTPPYVVRFSAPTPGQGVPSPFTFISPESVFVAVTPSALPTWIQIETGSGVLVCINDCGNIQNRIWKHISKLPSYAALAI